MRELDIGDDQLGADGDAFYEILMRAHEGLPEQESHALNTRLVLLMANRIGDLGELEAIIDAARGSR